MRRIASISKKSVPLVSSLKLSYRNVSKYKSYAYVTLNDLFDFLEHHQDIWDSRKLEKNLLGLEPDWLKEKRIRDRDLNPRIFELNRLKRQVINDNEEKVFTKQLKR